MGIYFEYVTNSTVTLEDLRRIVRICNEPNDQPWSLCDPISFIEASGDGLSGASKISPEFGSLDPEESRSPTTGVNDLEYVLGLLTQFSREFSIHWNIQIAGQRVGDIVDGECDPEVNEAVQMISNAKEIGPPWEQDGFEYP